MNGGALDCVTYLARAEEGTHEPSAEYMAAIITGAVENGLPADYVTSLRLIASV